VLSGNSCVSEQEEAQRYRELVLQHCVGSTHCRSRLDKIIYIFSQFWQAAPFCLDPCGFPLSSVSCKWTWVSPLDRGLVELVALSARLDHLRLMQVQYWNLIPLQWMNRQQTSSCSAVLELDSSPMMDEPSTDFKLHPMFIQYIETQF